MRTLPAILILCALLPVQTSTAQDNATIEEVVVKAQRFKKAEWERTYKSVAGKRIFEGPYGDSAYILAIGQELRNRGEKKRVMSRRIKMPQDFPGSSLDRYKYLLVDDCGIEKFQFYMGGEEFMALGYKDGEKEIIFDVMVGGGPFSSPGIWGPYDQILGRRVKMKLEMGDAKKDGMGLLASGYAIGLRLRLPSYELEEYGDVYSDALNQTGKCLTARRDTDAAKRVLGSR